MLMETRCCQFLLPLASVYTADRVLSDLLLRAKRAANSHGRQENTSAPFQPQVGDKKCPKAHKRQAVSQSGKAVRQGISIRLDGSPPSPQKTHLII